GARASWGRLAGPGARLVVDARAVDGDTVVALGRRAGDELAPHILEDLLDIALGRIAVAAAPGHLDHHAITGRDDLTPHALHGGPRAEADAAGHAIGSAL